MSVVVWHNPKCSKSREAVEVLQAAGAQPEVRLYLEDAPSREEIESLLQKLGLPASRLIREFEDDFKALGITKDDAGESVLINAMASNPRLIERAIAINGDKAVICRPPEKAKEVL